MIAIKFGGKPVDQLTATEKEEVRAISTLAAGMVGAVTGGGFEGAVTGGNAGYNSAVNNELGNDDDTKNDMVDPLKIPRYYNGNYISENDIAEGEIVSAKIANLITQIKEIGGTVPSEMRDGNLPRTPDQVNMYEDALKVAQEEQAARVTDIENTFSKAASDASRAEHSSVDNVDSSINGTPGRVQSRVNLKKIGMNHVLERHFNPTVNASQFSISVNNLKSLLQSREVSSSPVIRTFQSDRDGTVYVREVNVGRKIGFDKTSGNQPTSIMTVWTNKLGNLISAFPGRIK